MRVHRVQCLGKQRKIPTPEQSDQNRKDVLWEKGWHAVRIVRLQALWKLLGIYIYMRMYVYMCICVYVYMSICVYVYMCICVYVYMCVYVCVCMCMYVCMYLCMYVCMYVFGMLHVASRAGFTVEREPD